MKNNNKIDNMIFDVNFKPLNIKDNCDIDCPCGHPNDARFIDKRHILRDCLQRKKELDEFKINDKDADDQQYKIFHYKYLIFRQLLYGNKKEMLKNVEKCEVVANSLIDYVLFENGEIIIREEDGTITPVNIQTENAKLRMINDLHYLVEFHRQLLNCVAV